LEVAALVVTSALAIAGWNQPTVRTLAIVAFACVLAMITIWAAWINPINKTLNSWTPESIPAEWTKFRNPGRSRSLAPYWDADPHLHRNGAAKRSKESSGAQLSETFPRTFVIPAEIS
jgi:hypothetical protein